ncbi:uncharacterized protein LOC112572654 isoform X1 [Pomacea canaliculata]|uniref:uncharacterized protein LOC112572654 isoform X1 n=1 Tax=Pomacea canaliculata TaxID=400727 RepID=UPI000D73D4D0|nr:uncharacterized protein LOC112572654 isoform X1 [Pomacea canaliculata]
MWSCSTRVVLLVGAIFLKSLHGRREDVWKRLALSSTDGAYIMDSFQSVAAVSSEIGCAVTCSKEVTCHSFLYSRSSGQCFQTPSFKKEKSAFQGQLAYHVHYDGAICPLRKDYDFPSASLCWRLMTTEATFDAAREQCALDGASLLTIKTEESRALISTYLNGLGGKVKQVWLDAVAWQTNQSWMWSDGEVFNSTFSLWRVQVPFNTEVERCVKTQPDGTYYLRTAVCTQVLPYICQLLLPV